MNLQQTKYLTAIRAIDLAILPFQSQPIAHL